MKAMFLMDFVTVKKLLRRYLLLLLGMGGLAALMVGSHPGIIPYFGELSVISVAQALAFYDDRRDWSRFRLTMPLTRTGVVLGRYAFLAAVAVAGTLMGVALYLVVTLAVQEVPAYAALTLRPGGFDAIGLAWSVAVSFALAFVVGGIMLPTFFSFGMGNGPRYAMALVMMVSVLGINPIVNVCVKPEAAPAALGGLVSIATSPETFLVAAGALTAAAFALYAASCAACLAAYRRRDF
ncbi:ABC-2 transporter permease [Gordonibacter sp. RACS_AR68]|uniref:ABC-2 transporter permease n=1 Tax=Gordonibacter sp. RACS_AR68 TaxID=2872005 RepID=UPI00261B8714|nr:ABC-2 transporter permease [Gordonibacter sp. RACS_AR68]MDN4469396.1 ABC-2 transporter permease [Gordonibacter sp. RACS_AR68]